MRWHSALLLGVFASCAPVPTGAAAPNIVVSERSPLLTLHIDDRYTALPPLNFPIEKLTDAERRIFVSAGRDRVIDRMVIVQFETVQAGSDFRFLYPSTPPRRFGAETYRFGTFAYDDARAAAREPAKEAGKTRAHLQAAGYKPARLYRVARLARVTDPQGLSEVIIFYLENADSSPPAGQPDEDGDYALTPAETQELTQRMETTVRALKG